MKPSVSRVRISAVLPKPRGERKESGSFLVTSITIRLFSARRCSSSSSSTGAVEEVTKLGSPMSSWNMLWQPTSKPCPSTSSRMLRFFRAQSPVKKKVALTP